MESINDVLKLILSFEQEEFFSLDEDQLCERESAFIDMEFVGLGINGPIEISCDRQESLPIVMALKYSGERDWTIDLKKNCFLVASNLRNGNVITARALTNDKDDFYSEEKDDSRGPVPSGVALEAVQLTVIEARDKIPLDWNAGTWSFSLIYFDWVSNTISVGFIGNDPMLPVQTPQIDPVPDTNDINTLPSYVSQPQTPKAPKEGLAFVLEAQKGDDKQILNLYAAYAVDPRSYQIPKPPKTCAFTSRQENVSAVIPLTILLLSKNDRHPIQIDVSVPVFGKPAEESKKQKGQCALNVLSAIGVKALKPGKYACYVVLDGVTYGPQILNILS